MSGIAQGSVEAASERRVAGNVLWAAALVRDGGELYLVYYQQYHNFQNRTSPVMLARVQFDLA